MHDIVIADTSCLILLDKIGLLDLLKDCYNNVFITPDIASEFGQILPPWITIQKPKANSLQKTLEQILDTGESSALALAFEMQNATLVLDDLKARKIAKSLQFKITGTLGIIVKAKNKGIIKSVLPILNQLQQTDFRVSQKIIDKILEIARE